MQTLLQNIRSELAALRHWCDIYLVAFLPEFSDALGCSQGSRIEWQALLCTLMTKALFLGQAYHDFFFPWGSALLVQSSAKHGEPPVSFLQLPKSASDSWIVVSEKARASCLSSSCSSLPMHCWRAFYRKNVGKMWLLLGETENAGFVLLCMYYVANIAVRSHLGHPISARDYHRWDFSLILP